MNARQQLISLKNVEKTCIQWKPKLSALFAQICITVLYLKWSLFCASKICLMTTFGDINACEKILQTIKIIHNKEEEFFRI